MWLTKRKKKSEGPMRDNNKNKNLYIKHIFLQEKSSCIRILLVFVSFYLPLFHSALYITI